MDKDSDLFDVDDEEFFRLDHLEAFVLLFFSSRRRHTSFKCDWSSDVCSSDLSALRGQTVCRIGRNVSVDTIAMGEALARDRRGRELPVWQGCRTLRLSEIFLMNWDVQDSLDGRYFGPIPKNSIVGRALPLWTDEGGDGRYLWRAPTH